MVTTRNRNKALALLMAFLMAASMLVSALSLPKAAFAVDEGTLNIHKLDSVGVTQSDQDPDLEYWLNEADGLYYAYVPGATYEIYRIGTMTQADDPVNVTYTPIPGLLDVDGNPITVLDATTDPSSIDVDPLAPEDSGTTDGTGPLTFNTLDEPGIYLIKESDTPVGVNVSTDFIVTVPMYVDGEWTYTIDAFPKNVRANTAISKTITGADGDNVLYANVGDTIEYVVEVAVPSDFDIADYDSFIITDLSSPYLTIDEGTVQIVRDPGGNVLYDATDGTDDGSFVVDYTGNVLTITLTAAGFDVLESNDTLTITYEAVIDEGAASEIGGITNNVTLDLGTGELVTPVDPEPEVRIYSYGVKKYGSDGTTPLADATFVVATFDGTDYTYLSYNSTTNEWTAASGIGDATGFTTQVTGNPGDGIDSEAILQFMNLDPDTVYYLIETDAPAGYNTLPQPIQIQADDDSTDAVYASYVYDDATEEFVYVPDTGYSLSITNTLSSEYPGGLPETGGLGTLWFFIIGAILIATATGIYIYSRKKNQREQV